MFTVYVSVRAEKKNKDVLPENINSLIKNALCSTFMCDKERYEHKDIKTKENTIYLTGKQEVTNEWDSQEIYKTINILMRKLEFEFKELLKDIDIFI